MEFLYGIITDIMFLFLIMGCVKKFKLDFNKFAISFPWKSLIAIYIGLGIIRVLLKSTIG